MKSQNFIIPQKQQEFSQRIMNLALGRIYKNLHSELKEKEKKEMEKIFETGTDEQKENFIKKYLPDFEKRYKKELAEIEKELENEM
jgi:predicted adenine nucleotide alpha hydrolase (AANH) superfamily ATPase